MSNDPVVDQTTKEKTKIKSFKKQHEAFWLALLGFMALSSAVASIQHLNRSFTDDIYQMNFIENWIPWIAALFFALGWFITYWLEVVISKNQLGMARFLFVVILFGGLSISWCFSHFLSNEVLQRFDPMFLIYSGYFLRSSTFREENSFRLRKALFSKLIE